MLNFKQKIRNLKTKLFLWLMGKENHEMWWRLQTIYIKNMDPANYARIGKHCDLD